MYNNNFNNFNGPSHAPALFPEIKPLIPDFRPIGHIGTYDARSGMIFSPMDSFLQNKKVDPMGNVCHIGGLPTGAHVDSFGQLRDYRGNMFDTAPPVNPLLTPRVF